MKLLKWKKKKSTVYKRFFFFLKKREKKTVFRASPSCTSSYSSSLSKYSMLIQKGNKDTIK